MRVPGSFPKVPPRHGRLQLVTTGRARPTQSVAGDRLLAGKPEDRVITVGAREVTRHGFAQGGGHIEALLVTRGAPGREQTADDDPAIEEVGVSRGAGLERHGSRCPIPGCAGKEARGGRSALQVSRAFVLSDRVKVDEGAHRVARNLGRDRQVAPLIGTIITGYSAVRLLNTRAEKPRSGTHDLWEHSASVAGLGSSQPVRPPASVPRRRRPGPCRSRRRPARRSGNAFREGCARRRH